MMEVLGIDTILGLVGKPPKVTELSYNSVEIAESLRQVWNTKFIAFLPYCFSCKEPLVWHTAPHENDTIFHCSKCNRRWVRDEKWKNKKV